MRDYFPISVSTGTGGDGVGGGSATQAVGSRMLGWVGGARAYTTVGPGEESRFVLAVISQGWGSSVGTHIYPTGVTPQRPGRG